MINNTTLRTIQSGTIDEVYTKVTDAALYMATGGFLDQANKLLSELWKHKIPHDRKTWLPDKAFMMLWHVSNNKPDFIPFAIIDIDELEKDQREYVTLDKWGYKMENKDWHGMSGTDLLRTAFKTASLEKANRENLVTLEDITAFTQGEKRNLQEGETFMDGLKRLFIDYNKSNASLPNDSFPSKEKELLAADMLEKYIEEIEGVADAMCLAAELNSRNKRNEKAIFFAKEWAKNYHKYYLSYNFPLMACNRHVAPFLLKRILADDLKLSERTCKEFVDTAIKILDTRIVDGRSLVYGKLTWKQLIKKLSLLALKYAPEDFSDDIHKSKWLGFEKVNVNAIKATEKRLGVLLPDDYKDFLKTTNGLLAFPILNPELSPIEKIDFLKNIERPEIFELYKGYPAEENDTESLEEYVSRALLISVHPEEQMIWLIPPKEEFGNWQTWFFGNWVPGENRYPSFRHFIEEQIQTLEND